MIFETLYWAEGEMLSWTELHPRSGPRLPQSRHWTVSVLKTRYYVMQTVTEFKNIMLSDMFSLTKAYRYYKCKIDPENLKLWVEVMDLLQKSLYFCFPP